MKTQVLLKKSPKGGTTLRNEPNVPGKL